MTLTKDELIDRIYLLGFAKRDASSILELLLEQMKSVLETGEGVKITAFGKFSVRDKSPRRGRNPHTGESIDLPAHRVVLFSAAAKLRSAMNTSRTSR